MMPEALIKQWVSIPESIRIDEEFWLLWSVIMAAHDHLQEDHPNWIAQLERGVAELQAMLPSAIRGDEKEVTGFIFEMLVGIGPDTCWVGQLLTYQARRLCTALLLVPRVEEPEPIPIIRVEKLNWYRMKLDALANAIGAYLRRIRNYGLLRYVRLRVAEKRTK